jgi:hypothetical protein
MELQWAVAGASQEPGQVSSGTFVVGPDGTVVVGPYGTCAVGGLTRAQAEKALARHLAPYHKEPQVRLMARQNAPPTPAAPPEELAWRTMPTERAAPDASPANRLEPATALATPGDPPGTPIATTPEEPAVRPAVFQGGTP